MMPKYAELIFSQKNPRLGFSASAPTGLKQVDLQPWFRMHRRLRTKTRMYLGPFIRYKWGMGLLSIILRYYHSPWWIMNTQDYPSMSKSLIYLDSLGGCSWRIFFHHAHTMNHEYTTLWEANRQWKIFELNGGLQLGKSPQQVVHFPAGHVDTRGLILIQSH